MKRGILLALLLTCPTLTTTVRAANIPKPNVVLIVIDDLGWADLGCYGSKYFKTPHLDEMAAQGRRFTSGYAACPVCSPTRASLMTGRHPARLHITDWLPGRGDMPSQQLLRPVIRQELPLDEVTVAETLKATGYATAHIGKWHLGGAGFEPTRQGFDVNIGGTAAGSPPGYFAPFGKGGRKIPGLEEVPPGEYLTDRLTTEAEKFITAHRDEPFFVYLPHYTVHTPLAAKPDLIKSFAAWDGKPHGKQENPIYAAMIASMDESVGRILAKLKELALDEKTLVIFTSDNGGLAVIEGPNTPSTINAPLREGKGFLYEGGVRVPFLMRWPGKIAPGVDDTPVWSCDVLPTLAEFAGQTPQAELDGVSIASLLLAQKAPASRPFYWHYPHYSNQGGKPGGAVRDGNWKLIEFYESGRRELFDVAKDRSESKNVAAANPEVVERLGKQLAAWRERLQVQSNRPNPQYKPNPQGKEGVVTIPARTAAVHGSMLRYEPAPHKSTLGFWVVADDWASFDFELQKGGKFALTGLIGCGKGSGGSEVQMSVGSEKLTFTVEETGGFQQFVPRELGTLVITEPGRHTLEVRALKKPGVAVMDLREVKLTPVR